MRGGPVNAAVERKRYGRLRKPRRFIPSRGRNRIHEFRPNARGVSPGMDGLRRNSCDATRLSGRRIHAVVLVLLMLQLPTGSVVSAEETGGSSPDAIIINATDTMTFFVVEVPGSVGAGFEPHILAAPGVDSKQWYYVDAPTGLGSQESGWLFVSKDYGETWQFRSKGRLSGSWAGSGDSYTTVTSDGTIYFTDLLLATSTIQTSSDGGVTWLRNPVASVTPIDDRQWLSYGPTVGGGPFTKKETVYMSYNQIPTGLWIMSSQYTSLGLGWKAGNHGRPITADTHARDVMSVDPHDGTIYLPNTETSQLAMYVSTDGGTSFSKKKVLDGSPDDFQSIFVVSDEDEAGNVYLGWTDERNVTMAVSQDKGDSWRFLTVQSGNGTRVLPWIAGGGEGRAAMVWYETNETGLSDELATATWDVMAAVTEDVFAPNVTFYHSIVEKAVHVGTIRTSGASGNADRDLGDYMSCDVDDMGRLIMVYGWDGNDGIGKYDSKVIVARQVGGPFLKEGVGPVANFTKRQFGMTVKVDGSKSFDQNGGGISKYEWRWGDGRNDTGKNATSAHTYKQAGKFNLTLLVTNMDNMTGYASAIVTIVAGPSTSLGPLYLGAGVAAAVAAGIFVFYKYGRGRIKRAPNRI